ncbi:hypothetical protein ACFV2V_24320 [Streptomyces sp. NPDC059698]|uniref:hypothetical protein n=1 Tax=unclassified Streptomyces TaxID=2593676 RepID=UPI000939D27B|nr:hypothetical protein [Streptomyces sp. CB02366]OKJ32126.1 hypothetical protein AMK24_27375 [Streptomyces sp. CB02366]
MTITATETSAWKNELQNITADVTDPAGRAALESLSSALEGYFENPLLFRSVLGKIVKAVIDPATEEQITSQAFQNLDEFKAALPAGVTVTTLQ